ncbi:MULTISPECIES: helicase RepA family protein [unclassified Inquilinus]|uniref:helicase RepA family protein n=1 Tax=unclassified Inquilinus TaxID=2645927 RepID=UPI003F8F759C
MTDDILAAYLAHGGTLPDPDAMPKHKHKKKRPEPVSQTFTSTIVEFPASRTAGLDRLDNIPPPGKPARVLPGILWREIKLEGDPLRLVKGVLADNSLISIIGAPKCGKTFLALDLAVSIATGAPWRGRSVQQGSVIYIASEGQNGLRKRIEAVRIARQPDEDMPFVLTPVALDLASNAADTDALITLIKKAPAPPRLIVVNTLARNFGGKEESSAADMGAFVKNCDRIREQTGAAVCLIHHLGKDASRGGRGSSSLPAAVDTEIMVERGNDGVTRATVTLQKDGEDGIVFPFKLTSVDVGRDDDGDPITSLIVEHIEDDASPFPAKKGLKDAERNAMDALNAYFSHPVSDWITYAQFKEIIAPLAYPEGAKHYQFTRLRDALKRSQLIAVHSKSGNIALSERLKASKAAGIERPDNQ